MDQNWYKRMYMFGQ